MELRRLQRAAEFYQRAEGFLLQHEAHHNLVLGICAGLLQQPERVEQPPYLALVEEGGTVVAAAVMTPPHNLVLSLTPVPDALALIAGDVHREYPTLPGVLGPSEASRTFAGLWERVSGQPNRPGTAQRIYQLEAVIPPRPVPGELRRATPADRPLLIEWVTAFRREAHGVSPAPPPDRTVDARLDSPTSAYYVWHDGQPVSLAGYTGPTPNGIRIGPVYTPPEQRGKGYASACVAALSQLLLDGGRRYCFLFTDLSNPTANQIYQAIGYRPVCDVDEYQFLGGEPEDGGLRRSPGL